MMDINIEVYSPDYRKRWDTFIQQSKNGTFLFFRDYMDYHADRFIDYSLMFYQGNKLIAVMPANILERKIISHGGLTYGGIITNDKMTTPKMLEVFDALLRFMKDKAINKLIYKCVPYIYHSVPAQEDLYALFLNKGILIRRDVSTVIELNNKIKFSDLRKRGIKKAIKNGIEVRNSKDIRIFVRMVEEVLRGKFNTSPTHSVTEVELLASRFPESIKLFSAYKNEEMVAGVLVYESEYVAHAQYIAANNFGKKIGALDLIFNYLINDYYSDKRYFDFGISTENNGILLNHGLIKQKEMFGGRAVTYDFYELNVN